jgi:hypothetical protein
LEVPQTIGQRLGAGLVAVGGLIGHPLRSFRRSFFLRAAYNEGP